MSGLGRDFAQRILFSICRKCSFDCQFFAGADTLTTMLLFMTCSVFTIAVLFPYVRIVITMPRKCVSMNQESDADRSCCL